MLAKESRVRSMSELNKKLSLLKVKRRINRMKGIKDVYFLTTKPKEIAWYAGELNPIENPIPCTDQFSADVAIKDLSASIQSLVGNRRHFIIVLWEFSQVYVLFQMESLGDFLASYSSEFSTRDLTLFFRNEEKVVDLFLDEDKLEVRVFENKVQEK